MLPKSPPARAAKDQSVNGRTGANHIMLGHGDAIWYSDGKGHALMPPHTKPGFVWKDTAISITFDESGGYYDSGYVQPLDFLGDGPRIPLMVMSRFRFQRAISTRGKSAGGTVRSVHPHCGQAACLPRSMGFLP